MARALRTLCQPPGGTLVRDVAVANSGGRHRWLRGSAGLAGVFARPHWRHRYARVLWRKRASFAAAVNM